MDQNTAPPARLTILSTIDPTSRTDQKLCAHEQLAVRIVTTLHVMWQCVACDWLAILPTPPRSQEQYIYHRIDQTFLPACDNVNCPTTGEHTHGVH